MISAFWIFSILAVIAILAYNRASILMWTIVGSMGLIILSVFSHFHVLMLALLWILFLVPAAFLNYKPWRQQLLMKHLFVIYKSVLPKLSKTEEAAIAAGTVRWAGELFNARPNWKAMLKRKGFHISTEEQAFLDGPVETLCCMIDDWDITNNIGDIPPHVWQYIKDEGFFGMIIPKQYGGLEFSAAAHSAVIAKVASTGVTVASTIGVPNSLGPAELLLKYGTEEQKNHYLPRLARGVDVPCFALTAPTAGSDAGAIPDYGIVCKGEFNGKNVLGIKLNFNKRYITLAPVATVIGLAFKLLDPQHLLGKKENIGITCALLPRDLPGMEIGRRHFPLNAVFQNGPIHGKDVFIPLDFIIGGVEKAGHGWQMLIECLSVGRGITLPAISAGGSKSCALASGAYSRIRRQFGLAIGNFEGVQEALARIAGHTYFIDSIRRMTVGAIDRGEKPSVLTAITKYHATEKSREVLIDAMDIHGGKGICLGPNNYLGRGYQGVPISITVEGANILTRSMIIFGQGAIRCHPYVLKEMDAAKNPDEAEGLKAFDAAFTAHIGFVISNFFRSFILGVTHSYVAMTPKSSAWRYYQQLTRYCAAFAYLSDMAMFIIGGNLKRRENLSARLGDVLSYLFAGSAVLRRFHEQGEPAEDLPLVHWTLQEILFNIETQLDGFLRNFPNRFLASLARIVVFPFGRWQHYPSDTLGAKVACILLEPNDTRSRLGEGIYLGTEGHSPLGRLEKVLAMSIEVEDLEKELRNQLKQTPVTQFHYDEWIAECIKAKLISEEEGEKLKKVHVARMTILNVDDFDSSEIGRGG